jgi:hypothetical protein
MSYYHKRQRFEDDDAIFHCTDCGRECTYHEESFSYSGTHCTGGEPGTHFTGIMRSDCCHAEITMFMENDE